MQKWTIQFLERGWSLNRERSWHYHTRAKHVKKWREHFRDEALAQNIPRCEKIGVEVHTTFRTRRLQDPGNNYGAVKAAIDGLTDAGVIEDDIPEVVAYITFYASTYVKGVDSVTLIVHDLTDDLSESFILEAA